MTGALIALAALCWTRWGELADALQAIGWPVFGALAAMHLLTLAMRSEAWRLALGAVDGHVVPRAAVHGANAAAFVAGSVQAHAAMGVRIALLRRMAGDRAPGAAQIAVADVPLFVLEVFAACLLLVVAVADPGGARPDWWVVAGAVVLGVGLPLVARVLLQRFGHRSFVRGLAVLGQRERRGRLALAVAAICGLGAARVWLVLLAVGLPGGLTEVALVFAALGVLGLLPIGPSASPAATLAMVGSGPGGVAAALAAGLAISASSIAAVLLYAVAVGLGVPALRRADGAEVRRAAVQVERAEAIEARVLGPVEVARSRGQESEALAVLDDQPGLLGRVGHVERLDAVEAGRVEAVDRVDDEVVVVDVPEWMRPDGQAAGLVDELDGARGCRGGASDERRASGDEIGHEHRVGDRRQRVARAREALAAQALRVARMRRDRARQVRPADRRAVRATGLQLGAVDEEAVLLERIRHARRARVAIRAAAREDLEQPR